MKLTLRVTLPDGGSELRFVTGKLIRVGRIPGCEVLLDAVAFPMVSGVHAELDMTKDGLRLTPLSRTNKTLVNDVVIPGPVLLWPGDKIRLGKTGPAVEVVSVYLEPLIRPIIKTM